VRNYVKMLGMFWSWQGVATGDLAAWGANEEQLLGYVVAAENRIRLFFPGPPAPVFFRTMPRKVFWELNVRNFAVVLNGGSPTDAQMFYVNVFGGLFAGITSLESPRKTWSHGH